MTPLPQRQRGMSILAFIFGLVVGLGLALAIAVYVTKVPVPFIDRGVMASTEQEAEEAERNKNWDPNAGYNQNKNAITLADAPTPAEAPYAPDTEQPSAAPNDAINALLSLQIDKGVIPPAGSSASSRGDGGTKAPVPAPSVSSPAVTVVTPENSQAAPRVPSQALSIVPIGQVRQLLFFVQAGAYNRLQDAEGQRARLAIMGTDTRVTSEVVGGQPVYRVRAGPFKTRAAALATRQRLTDQNVESLVVVVPK